MGAVLRFRGAAQRIAVAAGDRDVTLSGDRGPGVLTFVATVTMDRGSGPARESWRVRSLWVEEDGEWRISELELVERLEGGGLALPF